MIEKDWTVLSEGALRVSSKSDSSTSPGLEFPGRGKGRLFRGGMAACLLFGGRK